MLCAICYVSFLFGHTKHVSLIRKYNKSVKGADMFIDNVHVQISKASLTLKLSQIFFINNSMLIAYDNQLHH